ncbi:hypothetical protein FRC09_011188 [Ceratobasidium sp. 395]|nr:hypothetical protein FRC09_011188 [Ceratobasidium sp. 395]
MAKEASFKASRQAQISWYISQTDHTKASYPFYHPRTSPLAHMAESLILAAAAATTIAPHVSQVATVALTVSKAIASLVHAVQVARDRHQDAQNIGFQTWIKGAEERSRIYYEKGASSPVSWVFTHGTEIPRGALVCGADICGSPLYVCRTFNRGGVHFGKAGRHYKKGAMFGYDGKEHEIEFYEVLVADESAVRWETASYPFYPRTFGGATLVEGGHEHDGSPLFLARAFYWGGTHPGKTSSYLKGADITFAGKEYVVNDFQVLVHNPTPTIQFACIEELD